MVNTVFPCSTVKFREAWRGESWESQGGDITSPFWVHAEGFDFCEGRRFEKAAKFHVKQTLHVFFWCGKRLNHFIFIWWFSFVSGCLCFFRGVISESNMSLFCWLGFGLVYYFLVHNHVWISDSYIYICIYMHNIQTKTCICCICVNLENTGRVAFLR